jgi:hypothetical protein
VAIADEEIGIQLFQVELDMSNPMRSVDETQHALLLAGFHEALKRHAHAGHTDHRVEYGDFHFATCCIHFVDLL